MNNSKSDRPADKGAPHEPELCVLMDTLENKKFLKYVKDRQRAFKDASKILIDHSNDLKVLMKQYDQAVCNGTPLGNLKKMMHTLIDTGASEAQKLLQVPADRTQNHADSENVAQILQKQALLLKDIVSLGQSKPAEKIEENANDARASETRQSLGKLSITTEGASLAATHADAQEEVTVNKITEIHSLDKVTVEDEQCVSENMGGVDSGSACPKQNTIGDGVQNERKRTSPEENVPKVKKAKKDVMFVLFGHPPRTNATDNRPLIKFLTNHGFRARNEHDIIADVPISTRLPDPKFLENFHVLSNSTETEFLQWLSDDAIITQFYLKNKERFGSEASRYCFVAKCSDIGEIRMIQYFLNLMQKSVVHNTFETFRAIHAMDFDALKKVVHSTSKQDLHQTFEYFSTVGRKDIASAFKERMAIGQSIWRALKSSTKSSVAIN